jgi:hypothetical protein
MMHEDHEQLMGEEADVTRKILNIVYVLKRGYVTCAEGAFGYSRMHLKRFVTG